MKKTSKFLILCTSIIMMFYIVGVKSYAAVTVPVNDYSGYSEVEDETLNKSTPSTTQTTPETTTPSTTTQTTTTTTTTTTDKANTAPTSHPQTGVFSTTIYVAVALSVIAGIVAVYTVKNKYNF